MTTEFLADGTMIVTLEDAPRTRFVVWQDESAVSPSTWLEPEDAQVLVYNTGHRGDTTMDEASTGTMQAFSRVYDNTGDATKALAVAERYARMHEPEYTIGIYTGRGYSQGDWWDTVTVVKDGYGTPESHAEEWVKWARGDVYVVKAEYLHDAEGCAHPGCNDEHWTEINAQGVEFLIVGGIYADDAEEAAKTYHADW